MAGQGTSPGCRLGPGGGRAGGSPSCVSLLCSPPAPSTPPPSELKTHGHFGSRDTCGGGRRATRAALSPPSPALGETLGAQPPRAAGGPRAAPGKALRRRLGQGRAWLGFLGVPGGQGRWGRFLGFAGLPGGGGREWQDF